MPEEIVTRILRLPGYGVYAWEADEATNTLTLAIRQTARQPYYVCGGCGIGVRYVYSWMERRLRDLPWGTWQVWLRVEVHRVHCPRCGVRTAAAVCDGQGPLHDAAGGGGGAGL